MPAQRLSALLFIAGTLSAAMLVGGVTTHVADGAFGANKAGCDVTKPQLTTAPGGTRDNHWIAENGLFFLAGEKSTYAALPSDDEDPPRGTYPLRIRRNGALIGKVPWFRDSRAYGKLEVRGTRHPGGDRMTEHYGNHLGPESEVVPGALEFPRKGCWEIRATSGDATLRATVWVIKVE